MEDIRLAKVYLSSDPFEPVEHSQVKRIAMAISSTRIRKLLDEGWVQFFFTKKTTGTETSIIATRNPALYTYTFKGGTAPQKAGLIRFVAFSRAGKPAWRSCYTMNIDQLIVENKNQAGGREGRNVKVDVNSGAKQTIDWDYEKHKP